MKSYALAGMAHLVGTSSSEWSQVRSLVRQHAWVVDSVPVRAHARSNESMFSLTSKFLSLSVSLRSPLSKINKQSSGKIKNKILLKFKNIH